MTTTDTKVFKGFHGWTAETKEEVSGYTWNITTLKRSSGKLITTAQAGTTSEDGSFSYAMFTSPRVTLITEKARATQNTVKEQHIKALLQFDNLKEAGELPVNKTGNHSEGYTIEVGQKVIGYGFAMSLEEERAIYNIENGSFGKIYHLIGLKSLKLSRAERIEPIEEKFGIGYYYKENDLVNIEELNNLVIEAKEKERKEDARQEAQKLIQEQVTQQKIEEGRKIVNVPKWAKSVIVAELYQNDSDTMTDYFSTSKSKTVYLAFSRTTRNNMQELKKAALNFEETKDFPELAENNSEREYNQVVEFTRGHSYLPDYFLGTQQWYGWKVSKNKYFDLTKEDNLNRLYIAASEDRFFCNSSEPEKTETIKTDGLTIEIVDYSEKAIAVIGDTKPLKDKLKAIGGRFNFRLKCGAGWIFPKSKTEEVKTLLNL